MRAVKGIKKVLMGKRIFRVLLKKILRKIILAKIKQILKE